MLFPKQGAGKRKGRGAGCDTRHNSTWRPPFAVEIFAGASADKRMAMAVDNQDMKNYERPDDACYDSARSYGDSCGGGIRPAEQERRGRRQIHSAQLCHGDRRRNEYTAIVA